MSTRGVTVSHAVRNASDTRVSSTWGFPISVNGEQANFTRLGLGCIEADFLQPNTHWKAIAEIYTIPSVLFFSEKKRTECYPSKNNTRHSAAVSNRATQVDRSPASHDLDARVRGRGVRRRLRGGAAERQGHAFSLALPSGDNFEELTTPLGGHGGRLYSLSFVSMFSR